MDVDHLYYYNLQVLRIYGAISYPLVTLPVITPMENWTGSGFIAMTMGFHLFETEKYQKNANIQINLKYHIIPFESNISSMHISSMFMFFSPSTFHKSGSFRTWYPLSSISSTAFDKGVTS